MPAINQDLLDKIIRYQIDLRRMDRTMQRDITRQLLDMRKELIAEISSGEIRSMTRAQARKVISNISEVLAESYSMASAALDDGLNDLAQMQVSVTQKQLESTVFVETSINLPSEAAVNRVTRNVLIEGGPLDAWWKRQEQDTLFKISNVIREGILLSEPNNKIIDKIVGKNGEPGILNISKRNASAVVQTAVSQVNNDARQLVYENNDDIIKALIHFSTLDSRTSQECIGRSGLKWKNDAAKTPIGHSIPFEVPPVHWNCRSVIVPETLTFEEMGVDLPEPTLGERASDLGPVSADTSFDDYLKRVPPAQVDDMLGKGRAELWRQGKITTKDLLDQNGRPLTLAELKARHA